MKKLLSFILLMGIFSTGLYAKRITVGTQEELKKVATLPRTEEYKIDAVTYLDLGVFYKRFVLGGPIWVTEEPKIVGLSSVNKDIYFELTDEEINEIAKVNNLNIEELKKLSFSERYLGLIIAIGLVLAFFLYFYFKSDKSEDVIHDEPSDKETTNP